MAFSVEQIIKNFVVTGNEDFAVAKDLLSRDRIRHGLFFTHLAVEKLLKAHVAKVTKDVPPRIHHLHRLATLAGLTLTEERSRTLGELNVFNLEGRYGDVSLDPLPTQKQAHLLYSGAEEVMAWLNQTL